jgi:Threonine aldolase
MTGAKLVPLPVIDGKVSPETVKSELKGFGFQHHSQPKVLSISQPTELGTLYSPSEIRALADLMHDHKRLLACRWIKNIQCLGFSWITH